MKTDSLFYRLFQNAPELLLELAELDFRNEVDYSFRSEEIKQTAFRLDGLMIPPANRQNLPVIFVEVQFQPDPQFYSRFFCEIFFYLHQNNPIHPWLAIVIYPSRKIETDGKLHYSDLLNSARVKRIYLEDFTDPPEDRIGLQLIRLIIVEEPQAIHAAQNLVSRIKTQKDRQTAAYWLEWVETILVYKLPRLSREEIQTMLGYNDIELKQTRFYQDVYSEGKLEGKVEGESTIILRLLQRRLGTLPSDIQTRIQQMQNTQLEALADQLWELDSLDKLQEWLKHTDL